MDLQRRDFIVKGTLVAAAASTAAPALGQANSSIDAAPPSADAPYQSGTAIQKLEIVNTIELEDDARKILPKTGIGYIAGGCGGEWTKRENMAAYERVQIEPMHLSGVDKIDLSTTLLGARLAMPIIVPPMGSQGLAHVSKELGTARAASEAHTLMVVSTQANASMEEIAAVAPGPKWFQLYMPKDRGFARELIMRAKAAGYQAIVPTIDNQVQYPRENNIRDHYVAPSSLGKGNTPRAIKDPKLAAEALGHKKIDLTWDDMIWIKQETGLPVVVKGVLSPKVAAAAVARGMDAVYVSNHGGRALDGVSATLTALPRIADAVQGRLPIICDSGIRRGADVFKALALGANVVGCGRPILYGLALGGWMGAKSVLDHLAETLTITMQLAGTPNVKAITRDYLAPHIA